MVVLGSEGAGHRTLYPDNPRINNFQKGDMIPQELRENVEFTNARIDAVQAAVATALSAMQGTPGLETRLLRAFQDMDDQLVAKWPDIGPAIRERGWK